MAFPKIECIPLQGIDLECCDGEYRTFYGCSLEGLFEFEDRRSELAKVAIAHENSTIDELYQSDKRFRFLVNRCLMLNGIKPAWVALRQIEGLLFVREVEGVLRMGALIELNTPASRGNEMRSHSKDEPQTLEEAIALLAFQCSGLQEAIDLARNEPAKRTMAIAKAKADFSKPPEEKRKDDLREFARRERMGGI